MPFIRSYNGAMQLLSSIGTGKCKGECKSSWLASFRNALKSKTNPLKLTAEQKKRMTQRIKEVSKRNAVKEHSKTLKKYASRKSPSYKANDYCGKSMKGNDGNMYVSRPNKNNVCSWKKAP
jgi:hypothetical protein